MHDDAWSISPIALREVVQLSEDASVDVEFASQPVDLRCSRLEAVQLISPQVCAASSRKVKSKLLMPKGIPTWVEVPVSAPQAEKLQSCLLWRSAREVFLDKTAAYPGFVLVEADAPELQGVPLARLLWEFKAKLDGDDIVRKARLCWDETSLFGQTSSAPTFADCAVPQAWKVMLDYGASVGATMVRRDVPNAHQSTVIPVDADICRYSHCPPCHPLVSTQRRLGTR